MTSTTQVQPILSSYDRWWSLVILLIITFSAAALGAMASVNAPTFYGQLLKPTWAPPPGLFGPVWTVLYSMMTLAAWLVVRQRGWRAAAIPMGLYVLQLLFNALWSWFFFRWQWGDAALVDVILMWLAVLTTTVMFWRVRPVAGLLLLPYLAWVSFASVLTYAVWQLNPTLL